jgi:hypothetical protein
VVAISSGAFDESCNLIGVKKLAPRRWPTRMLGAREFVGGGETTTFIVGAGEINRSRGRLACHRGALETEGEKALVTFSITSQSGIFIGIGGGEINNIIINRWWWRWRWRWRLRSRQHHHQKNHGELHARRWHEEPRCCTLRKGVCSAL